MNKISILLSRGLLYGFYSPPLSSPRLDGYMVIKSEICMSVRNWEAFRCNQDERGACRV